MALANIRKDEGIGLAVALALHLALLAALILRPAARPAIAPPERIEVTISDQTGSTSTAPEPARRAASDRAPDQGEAAPEPEPAAPRVIQPPLPPVPAPKPIVQERPRLPQASEPEAKPARQPIAKPIAKPAPKAPAKAERQPPPRPREAEPARKQATARAANPIDRIVSSSRSASPSSSGKAPASPSRAANPSAKPPAKAGASRIDADFLKGLPGAKAEQGKGTPASEIGPQARSALSAAISRQLKPHWEAPQGADAELLVTKLRFRLNPDGGLAGEPEVLGTTGQTDANRAQVRRHQEQAVRAVKLAAPFELPDDLYEGWKVVTTNFDRRLSQ